MTYGIRISEQARLDLKMIYEYIADTMMAPLIAQKQYTRIENAVYSLDHMPERFRQYEKSGCAASARGLIAPFGDHFVV